MTGCYSDVTYVSQRLKMVDASTKKTLATIPLLKTRAGPRDGDVWVDRLKEEYLSLIQVRFTLKQPHNGANKGKLRTERHRWSSKAYE